MMRKARTTFGQLKVLFSVLCLLGTLLLAGGAKAAPITFIDFYGNWVLLNSTNKTYSYNHNISDNGFNSASDTLNSATLSLVLIDDSFFDAPEVVQLSFDGTASTSFGFNSLFGAAQFDISVSQLTDGILNVVLTQQSGDFYFGGSTLQAQGDRGSVTDPSAVHAPEPSTLLLLGSGLMGLGLWGGRKRLAQRRRLS
jgi:hypothetical protein